MPFSAADIILGINISMLMRVNRSNILLYGAKNDRTKYILLLTIVQDFLYSKLNKLYIWFTERGNLYLSYNL